ncbi:MAG: phage tail protein [Acidobacteriota bacterium]
MNTEYYPPGGFFFAVTVVGTGMEPSAPTDIDASFQEVSGISADFNVEELTEGGENRFVHRLPRPARYANLVLKRGIVTVPSFLADWSGQTIGANLSLPIVTQNLMVSLLNETGFPVVTWGFFNAYPVKWEISPMDSMENRILTETLEFSYNYFERINRGN